MVHHTIATRRRDPPQAGHDATKGRSLPTQEAWIHAFAGMT